MIQELETAKDSKVFANRLVLAILTITQVLLAKFRFLLKEI